MRSGCTAVTPGNAATAASGNVVRTATCPPANGVMSTIPGTPAKDAPAEDPPAKDTPLGGSARRVPSGSRVNTLPGGCCAILGAKSDSSSPGRNTMVPNPPPFTETIKWRYPSSGMRVSTVTNGGVFPARAADAIAPERSTTPPPTRARAAATAAMLTVRLCKPPAPFLAPNGVVSARWKPGWSGIQLSGGSVEQPHDTLVGAESEVDHQRDQQQPEVPRDPRL